MPRFEHPLAPLVAALVNAREQERARAARLLHDEIGQILSATGLQLDVLRMDTEAASPEIARRITEIQRNLEQAVNQVRALSQELNPSIVERAGLRAALEQLADRYREMSSIAVRVAFDSSVRLPAQAAVALYKIAEHALDNVARHSGTRQAELLVRPAGEGVTLEISDGGRGFQPEEAAANPAGLGLLLMQCHADRAGLDLNIASTPGNGTIVRARYSPPPNDVTKR
ncbi:MAG: hypothetical protein J7M38_05360 [Armatimonadetes bacterium]|nr:hypothetical protein [Armatimonadota bacterium]